MNRWKKVAAAAAVAFAFTPAFLLVILAIMTLIKAIAWVAST